MSAAGDSTKVGVLEVKVQYLTAALEQERADRQAREKELNAKLDAVTARLGYYDKVSLRWGSFCLGALTLGALIWAGADKVKEKVLGWFL